MSGGPEWRDAADSAGQDPDAAYVDDIVALRRAEAAVAHDEPFPLGPPVGLDEDWVPVARSSTWPAGLAGLEDVARVLTSVGISFGWDPHDPHENPVGFAPGPGIWPGSARAFSLLVQTSHLEDARAALVGPPPPWVTYVAAGAGAEGRADPVVDPLFDATPHAGPPSLEGGPARADGALLSDNARLEAGQPRSGCALSAAFLLFALLAAAVVAYVVTRG